MTTPEAMRKERFDAVKARVAAAHDGPWSAEEMVQAQDDLAWLAAELTGAANALAWHEVGIATLRKELEYWKGAGKRHNKMYGEMSAKIGQARAEAALARERLRAVTKRLHEDRRDFTDRHVNPSLFGELADIKPVDVQMPNEGHPFFRRSPRAFKYPVC